MLTESHSPTLVAEGSRVEGNMTFFSGAGLFGIIEGEITQQSSEILQVGRSGWVQGAIQSQGPVLIEGRVDGNIQSTKKITLTATAQVKGSIQAPQLDIRAGAVFDGVTQMSSSLGKPALKKSA